MGEVRRGRRRRGRGGAMGRSGNEKGEGEGGGRGSQSVRWFQPLTLIVCVCVGMEVSCKQS